MNVGRLITPPVRDMAIGAMIEGGPTIDDAQSWAAYRREQPDRRYATAKRALARRELRRHGLELHAELKAQQSQMHETRGQRIFSDLLSEPSFKISLNCNQDLSACLRLGSLPCDFKQIVW